MLPTLIVYSRPGCHLCDDMVEQLLPLVRGRARVETANIESDDEWLRRFSLRIPVLELDGHIVCEGHLDLAAVQAVLQERSGEFTPAGSGGV